MCRLSLLSRGVKVGTVKGTPTPGAMGELGLGVAESLSHPHFRHHGAAGCLPEGGGARWCLRPRGGARWARM